MLTSKDILEKRFSTSFRGYDVSQVDDFLDEIKLEFDKNDDNINKLKEDILKHDEEKASEGYMAKVNRANEIIEKAKAASEKYVSDSKVTAERILTAASIKASDIKENASGEVREDQSFDAQKIKSEITMAYKDKLDRYLLEVKKKATELYNTAQQTASLIIDEAKTEAEVIKEEAIIVANDEAVKIKQTHSRKLQELKVQETQAQENIQIAKQQADKIMGAAQNKASDTKKMMNIMVTNSKQRLDTIEKSVVAYKAKFDNLIQEQSDFFSNIVNEGMETFESANDIKQDMDEKDTSIQADERIMTELAQSESKDSFEDKVLNIKFTNPMVDFTDIVEPKASDEKKADDLADEPEQEVLAEKPEQEVLAEKPEQEAFAEKPEQETFADKNIKEDISASDDAKDEVIIDQEQNNVISDDERDKLSTALDDIF
jgi:cell division initiation protein